MTASRSDGRQLISVTMQPELFERIKAYCRQVDIPVSTWARQLMVEALERQQ